LATVRLLGTTVSESRGSGAGEDVVVMVTGVAVTTVLPGSFVQYAVIVVKPTLWPVTSPLVVAVQVTGFVTGRSLLQIVAIDGVLDPQVRYPVVVLGVVMLVTSV
jgi:hypothetical protein